MGVPDFREWLIAVAPRFPKFSELAKFASEQAEWPGGYEKTSLRAYLRKNERGELVCALAEALEAFDLLCTPSIPKDEKDGLLWEWHTPELVERTRASIKRHSRHSQVPTAQYRWELGRDLASKMARMTRIYIDTCHWIKMRDFELGRSVPHVYGQILERLRRLVSSGEYICLLSPALLLELETQSDGETRLHTARLMEELSKSVGLPHIDEMEKLELRRRAFERLFGTGALNADWQVWTKAAFILGEVWPKPPPGLAPEQVWWVQKCYLDSMWEAPFGQIVGALSGGLDTKELRSNFAQVLNADRDQRQAADFEFERQRAVAMVVREIIMPTAFELARELQAVASRRPDFRMPDLPQSGKRDPWCLPSVQIIAGIEALIRTTNRRFRGNDMFDLFHCAAAIPYCQVFLCDTAFKHMVTDPKLRYDRDYGATILSEPQEIWEYLSAR